MPRRAWRQIDQMALAIILPSAVMITCGAFGEATMNQRRLFAASCVALVATAMTFAIRGDIMSDFERDFGLSKTDVGWIAGAAFWGFGLSILLGGPLCDLLGMGTLLRLAAMGHIAG